LIRSPKAVSASLSALCERLLATHPRVVVHGGARSSQHDNPVDRIWAALKA